MTSLENINAEGKRQLDKIAEIEKHIDKIKNEFENANLTKIEKELDEQKSDIAKKHLEVAIVGCINAGKSTFINSFFQENIASMDVTPETASLTKFTYSETNNLTISFYKENEWEELWKSVEESDLDKNQSVNQSVFKREFENLNANSIKNEYINREELFITCGNMSELIDRVAEYTSKKSAKHYFVKEITVGLNNKKLPKDIVFVDTPGLNDVVKYRSKITEDYIRKANAVLVCVESSRLTKQELTTILEVFENVGKNVDRVLILGTKLDTLNEPKKEWEKQKKQWINYLIYKYKDENIMNENILGVSSFVDMKLSEIEKENSIDENSIDIIKKFARSFDINLEIDISKLDNHESLNKAYISAIKSNISNIRKHTNINNINRILDNNILSKSSEIIIDGFKRSFSNIITDIKNRLYDLYKENNEVKESLDMDEKAKREYIAKKKEEIEELKEGKNEINKAFEKLKSDWLKSNDELKNEMRKM